MKSLLLLLTLTPLMFSCHSLTPAEKRFQNALQQIDPVSEPLAQKTEIIDIHTHTFNSRYLPLRGILLGKRDLFPPFSWLISDCCAIHLADAISRLTREGPLAGEAASQPAITPELLRQEGQPGFLCGILIGLIEKGIQAGAWDPGVDFDTRLASITAVADQMNPLERTAIRTAGKMMGFEELLTHHSGPTSDQALVRFLWLLTQSDSDMVPIFRQLHGDQGARITLVSHAMDLGPVYAQQREEGRFYDFVTEQLPRLRAQAAREKGRMLWFVAYNPFRDHTEGGQPGSALRIVREAVEKYGASGVKIYPPSGYRPAANDIPRKPRPLFTRHPGAQWENRFGSLDAAELNRRLAEVLDWCLENDVPVFTHAGHGEFEARKGYGEHHSHPKWWRAYLESKTPSGKSRSGLRLCLGHAGGEEFWLGKKNYSNWGQETLALCREFPHVYCEITINSFVVEPKDQARFGHRLTNLLQEETEHKNHFGDKLLYGTDWFLPDGAHPAAALRATQAVFLTDGLRPFYQRYFFENSRRFLKIHPAR
ncbi:amidohydrolase family protein [Roseibacillus ishigakijimensis]|uniref:Amidohydrolase family protein n=1 Tax=Roseibacillus ishigakijimensis TaxID=454146 RepID=A0A934RPG2_9BACT|nr:amidohydrolase family protein [Roseibacillus ishigakijimensis]MBK1833156.1 amidohydrolase family protein [Roseibacillus ishigakijimensis]